MPAFVVHYDLYQGDRSDYQELYDALERAKAVRATESTWYISTAWDAGKLGTYLRKFTHKNDVLVVDEMPRGGSYTSFGLSAEALAWKKQHLKPLPPPSKLKSRLQ